MNERKRCPTCGQANPAQEMLCLSCMADISSVPPTPDPAAPAHIEASPAPARPAPQLGDDSVKTVRDGGLRLSLRFGNLAFSVGNGEVMGRTECGKEFLSRVNTVSRAHARFSCEAGGWWVEDLGSTNGTFVNGQQLEAHRRHTVRAGDKIGLSSRIELDVIDG